MRDSPEKTISKKSADSISRSSGWRRRTGPWRSLLTGGGLTVLSFLREEFPFNVYAHKKEKENFENCRISLVKAVKGVKYGLRFFL